jgi:hypothetical protein
VSWAWRSGVSVTAAHQQLPVAIPQPNSASQRGQRSVVVDVARGGTRVCG